MKVSVVVPAFNEGAGISQFIESMNDEVFEELTEYVWEMIVVDDGSTDNTWEAIVDSKNRRVRGIRLTSNCGHQVALEAGLKYAEGDLVLTMDADFQHPTKVVKEMLRIQRETKSDIVQAVVSNRGYEKIFRKIAAYGFYSILSAISNVEIKSNAGDFRLITSRVAQVLLGLPERNKVFRFLIPSLGFSVEYLNFEPDVRRFGTSKYSLTKLLKLASLSIFGFSSAPLRLVAGVGLFSIVSSLIFALYVLMKALGGLEVPGWASTALLILLMGSVQILILSLVARFLFEIIELLKVRPKYIIKDTSN
jgi:dolichol-phosphate mannosyltransferase